MMDTLNERSRKQTTGLTANKCSHASCGILLLAFCGTVMQGQALWDTDEVVTLAPLVVTGTAFPMEALMAASDIGVLAGDEKQRRQGASLGASLEHLPSVATVSTGSGVGLPVVRGLSGNRIKVMQDGIGMNYQQFGIRHPVNMDPYLSERIELVRGVSSILYGSDAFGGVVNAVSADIPFRGGDSDGVTGQALYRYESGNELNTGALQFAYGETEWGLLGGVVWRDAGNLSVAETETWNGKVPSGQRPDLPRFDGELDFTDFEQLNMMLKGGLRLGRNLVSIRLERWQHDNNYLLPDGKGIGVELENNQVQLMLKGQDGNDMSWRGSYTFNENLRWANPDGTPLPVRAPAVELDRRTQTLRAELTVSDPDNAGLSGSLGVEGIYEEQQSKGPAGLTPGGTIENLAVFGLGRLALQPWSFEAGLRYDHRSLEADPARTRDPKVLVNRVDPVTGAPVALLDLRNRYDVVTASFGTVYQLHDSLVLAANVNRGFRAPTLFELYAAGVHGGVAAVQFGEANLREETSFGGDLQARWRGKRMDWTATVYLTDFADFIYLADTGVADSATKLPIFKVAQAGACLHGGDLSATLRATDWLDLQASFEWVRGAFDAGGDVPLLPADQIRVEAVLRRPDMGSLRNPQLRLSFRHAFAKDSAGPQEPFSQFDRNPNFGTASTDAYNLLDIAAGFTWRSLTFDLMLTNATDEAYRDFLDTYKGYALSPGRNLILQVAWAF